VSTSDGSNRRPRHVEVRGGAWGWRSGWGEDRSDRDRSNVPWLGLALVVLGVLFLADEFLPAVRVASSLVFLAIGVGLLGLWLLRRRSAALYAGTLITALAVPSLLRDVGLLAGGGWTTVSLGVGFLFIALVRYADHGGWGWQAWVGAILVVVGGASTTDLFSRLGWPILLVAVGLLILFRGSLRPGGSRRW
jgi:hypothetical protein